MKIEILRSVMISGELATAGSFAEVSLADANLLIGMGKARFAVEAAPAPEPEVEAPKKGRKPAAPSSSDED